MDLSDLSLARSRVVQGWKLSETPSEPVANWHGREKERFTERFFKGPNELRIIIARFANEVQCREIVERSISSYSSTIRFLDTRNSATAYRDFTSGKTLIIGAGLCVHRQIKDYYLKVWYFGHSEKLARGLAKRADFLTVAESDRLLQRVSIELQQKIRSRAG